MMMTKEFRKHSLEKHGIARKSGLWIGNNVGEAPNAWTRTMERHGNWRASEERR